MRFYDTVYGRQTGSYAVASRLRVRTHKFLEVTRRVVIHTPELWEGTKNGILAFLVGLPFVAGLLIAVMVADRLPGCLLLFLVPIVTIMVVSGMIGRPEGGGTDGLALIFDPLFTNPPSSGWVSCWKVCARARKA